MPYLQFETTLSPTAAEREAFAAAVTDLYADVMDAETSYAGVVIRTYDASSMALGRAEDGPLLFLKADIRRGRPFDLKRDFALRVMDEARERWDVPNANMKVVFTEHEGEQIMGYERVGDTWDATD